MQCAAGGGGGGEPAVRKGPWTMEEDLVLADYVAANGEGAWNSLARAAGTCHIDHQYSPAVHGGARRRSTYV